MPIQHMVGSFFLITQLSQVVFILCHYLCIVGKLGQKIWIILKSMNIHIMTCSECIHPKSACKCVLLFPCAFCIVYLSYCLCSCIYTSKKALLL